MPGIRLLLLFWRRFPEEPQRERPRLPSIHGCPIKSSMDSGAMKPSNDIDTLKNTFPAISPQLPSERCR